jgi:novobiocin biosynthesis protein NovU/D-mycarose 3-C-methyltransferase
MEYEDVSLCRCCGAGDLAPVLDLGRQPLANSYTREPAELPTYPLVWAVCRACGHGQLSIAVHPDLMFRHYLYVSGTSRTLRDHFAALAREALDLVGPGPRRVLDLACNDGTLLETFRAAGASVQGVDPAANLVALAAASGLDVVEGYWPAARAQVRGPFDLITAANVLAHVADPRGFLEAALDSLADGGAVVVEVPYCRDLVARCAWDTIYHEHLSYFLVGPLLRLAERAGATVSGLRRLPVHGGSLRLVLRRGRAEHCPEARALAEAERQEGLHDLRTYQAFARRVAEVCSDLQELVRGLLGAGLRVIGYGAAAKGNTLLNRCQLPLTYIVDDNPLKHGYLTPGRQIPIRPPEAALGEAPGLYILLLAWNFAAEILARWRARRPGFRDRVIHFVPEVRCHDADADCPPLE